MNSHLSSICFSAALLLGYTTEAQHVVNFQTAKATSAFSSGAFPAADALSAGSGYWCSSGNHAHGERVAWIGSVAAEPVVAGVSIDWAYGPGEFRIMTSTDGGNFQESAGWRAASREEESYREIVMFDSPKKVKALQVVMRSPRSSGFFGINGISLLTQPGPSMLVSGSAANLGESCLTAAAGSITAQSCVTAIAGGSGAEVFGFSQSSQLVSASTGECLVSTKSSLKLQNCEQAADAEDGRSTFTLGPSSQLQTQSGDCVFLTDAGASAAPCSSGEGKQVFLTPVREVDSAPAAHVRDVSALLLAAAARQSTLLEQLKSSKQGCQGLLQGNVSQATSESMEAPAGLTQRGQMASSDAVSEAVSEIDAAMHVDLSAVKKLIAESKAVLASR